MITITSLQNPRVKDAVHLRDRRHREKHERIVIDGVRELGRAIDGGVQLVEAFVCPKLCQSDEARQLLARLTESKVEILEVSRPVFDKLAFGQRAEGILGVAAMPRPTLGQLVLPPQPLVAVLERVEKPGNVGAVLRSADGAGLDAVVLADPRTDLYNPAAIRASLGTIFSVRVCTATAAETVDWLRRHDLAVYAARVDAAAAYTQVDFRRSSAIVLGSEAQGLTGVWSVPGITGIRLPMLGIADSLNVSVAAAVLFYEARRQREL